MFLRLRSLLKSSARDLERAYGRRKGFRPLLERLENRTAPANAFWTNGGLDGLWSNPGNWSTGAVPGANDVALFQEFSTSADCLYDLADSTVGAVVMGTPYNRTLTIGGGTLRVGGDVGVASPATLALGEGSTVQAGRFLVSGPIVGLVPSSDTPARLTTTGNFWLQTGGSITVVAGTTLEGAPPGLIVTSTFSDGGTINIGVGAVLTFVGPFVQVPFREIVFAGIGILNFSSGGVAGAYPHIEGTIKMFGSTINTNLKLSLEAGSTLESHSNPDGTPDVIGMFGGVGGNLENQGAIHWLDGFHEFLVVGSYTGLPSAGPGTLHMRIANGGAGDRLTAGVSAQNLRIMVTAVDSLVADQAWDLAVAPVLSVYSISFPPGFTWSWVISGGVLTIFN